MSIFNGGKSDSAMNTNSSLAELLATLPQHGSLRWIGLRPARREALSVVSTATLCTSAGLLDDRYAGRNGKRQVTLIQYEHLPVIAALLHRHEIDPALLRRNLAVSGINLLALKGKHFKVGSATLEFTGLCHPCSRMEEYFGAGGYNAMRGHGGITARVVSGGEIALNDSVIAL